LNGSRILVVGLAYKKNVADFRESPALKIMELLEKRGALVDYHDPHIPVIPTMREYHALHGRRSVDLDVSTVASYDAAVIVTDHDAVDYGLLCRASRIVVDTRNAVARAGVRSEIVVKA
jgi:UDP-N-acetyl-D-glucosamine dehydrogenase